MLRLLSKHFGQWRKKNATISFCKQLTNNKVMLLDDLPEELVRKIFGYFTDADVYFKLRYICRKIHEYAESYVELGELNI